MKVKVVLKSKEDLESTTSYRVYGSTAGFSFLTAGGDPVVATIDPTDSKALVAEITADNAFENNDGIRFFDPMTIEWTAQHKAAGETVYTEEYAGNSQNQVYVTLGEPHAILYHTLVHIACKNANGENTANDAVTKIWGEFTDRYVQRVDGMLLKYYGNWTMSNYSTATLLINADGRCGAWMRFLIDILALHNITATDVAVIPEAKQGFLIKTWRLPAGAGPFTNDGIAGINPWTFIGTSSYQWQVEAVSDGRGIPGQGTANPASIFANHALVRYNGTLYDPSYGVSYANVADMEKNISGYFTYSEQGISPNKFMRFTITDDSSDSVKEP
jgi:hypothetical protein